MGELSTPPNPLGVTPLYSLEKRRFTMVLYRLSQVERMYQEGHLPPSPYAKADGVDGGSSAFFLHRP